MEILPWILFLTALAAGFLSALYLYFSVKFKYWRKSGVPYIQPTFPTGNVSDLLYTRKSIAMVYADFYKKFEGQRFAGIYQFHVPILLILDPELIKNVLVKDFEHFHDRGFPFDEKIEPLAANLFQLNGAKWKNLRTKLTPALTSGKLKMMIQIMTDCGKELKKFLEEPARKQEATEVKEILSRFTTDIIASTVFGIECNCLKDPNDEVRQWGREMFEPSFNKKIRNLLYLTVPELAMFLGIPSIPTYLSNFFIKFVEETVGYREKNNVERNDFIQMLIQLKNLNYIDKEGKAATKQDVTMTISNVAAQAFAFFAAGFETTATTMTFCLYELALNPYLQDRLRKEIDTVLEKHDGEISYNAIQEMDYLDNVVSETLRKHPAVPFLIRQCTKEYRIPDSEVVVETGSLILIPIMGLHYDAKYYPEPTRFDPDRFTEEVKKTRHHYCYLPFGGGPHICIGKQLALLQTKVGLVSILSKYEFAVCDKTNIPIVYDDKTLVLFMKGGTWLQIKNRSQ